MSRLQMEELSSSPSTASTSQEDHESVSESTSSRKLRVTLLSSEWRSTKGGLSTINRELAIQLAKHPKVNVSVYLPQCSEEDKQDATSHDVHLIKAEAVPGYNPVDWLSFLPEGQAMDCVVGYGVVLGRQVQLIKRYHKCKWIQIVNAAPEEQGMYKHAILRAEKLHQDEVKLCEKADQVVAVGPKLADVLRRYLRFCRKDQDVLNLTPGIFSDFADVMQATEERKTFSVLMFGPDDNKDFNLNGYDIAARAIAELKGEPQPYKLLFVGAPRGEEEKVKELLLQQGINRRQLTVRCFCESREQLAWLFCEVDLAIMPSRSEGFGLAALEALSAGLPVLVSGNSGLGEALKDVLYGSICVVDSEDPKDWANAIKAVRQKDREMRLKETEIVRDNYVLKYSWKKECDKLVERMSNITLGGFHTTVQEPFVSSKPEEASTLCGDILAKKHPILASECRRRSVRRPFPPEKPWPEKEELISSSKVNPIPHSERYVQVSPLEIFVQVTYQEIITLKVDASDTIANLKEKIKDKKGFPAEEQPLFFQRKTLKDDRTVSDYNIQNKSTLNLKVPAEQMDRLEVTILTEGRIGVTTLVLKPKDTIGSVKDKIHAKTKISPHQQVLKFNDKQLDDVHSLNYYGIENKSNLFLCVSVEILVRMTTGTDVMLSLFKSNTIKDVKERIQLSEDIPCDMQRLYFLYQLLRDNYPLSYYNIKNGCVLNCDVLLIRINVKMPTEDVISLDICPKDRVRSVMDEIQARGAIPPNQLSLVYNGEKLNNRFTLNHYKLRNGSFLNADLKLESGGIVEYQIDSERQGVLNYIARKYFQEVDVKNPEELNRFLKYMEEVRKVTVADIKTGSLIFTLECGSVQILDDLWEDYRTGHLNEVAQLYLVTDDILEELGLSSLKLTSNMKEEDYKACRQRLATVEANQMLDRLRTALHDAFSHWLATRRNTKGKLEEVARKLLTATALRAASAVMVGLVAYVTFGSSASLMAAAGIGALIGGSTWYRSNEEILMIVRVQRAIDTDRRACVELQEQLDFLEATFTSTSAGAMIGNVSYALTRASRFADASVLPRDIIQLVNSSLDRNQGSTAPIVEEIRSILNNLKCPDETEIQRLVAGLSLRAGGRGFSPATKRVAPGYFYWKIEEK